MVFIARWDLDKTYLRTEFDTLGSLVRTAFERPDQKRTVPGAAALMRELGDAQVAIHIVSGSPELLRRRIADKLDLDGVRYASLTLKPNVQNLLRLRFRALRGQLGYKLPALLRRRCELPSQRNPDGALVREVLLGDDAETDALVYSLYADVCEGTVDEQELGEVMRAGRAYDDDIRDAQRFASYIEPGPVVERILIHLDRQSHPEDFRRFGPRVVPFFNYLQAAFALFDDGRLPANSVLRVALDLAGRYHFDGAALGRSYLDLHRRGHVTGRGLDELGACWGRLQKRCVPGSSELGQMVDLLGAERFGPPSSAPPTPGRDATRSRLDYRRLAAASKRRRRPRR